MTNPSPPPPSSEPPPPTSPLPLDYETPPRRIPGPNTLQRVLRDMLVGFVWGIASLLLGVLLGLLVEPRFPAMARIFAFTPFAAAWLGAIGMAVGRHRYGHIAGIFLATAVACAGLIMATGRP